jgi:hypothetical protein
LTARLEKTALSEKMIEEDLSQVEESATKSTYRLGVGFERRENKGEKSAPKFIPSSTTKGKQQSNLPIQPKAILQPKERNKERNPHAERGSFCVHVLWPCWSLG